jgi:hypothetical protein
MARIPPADSAPAAADRPAPRKPDWSPAFKAALRRHRESEARQKRDPLFHNWGRR